MEDQNVNKAGIGSRFVGLFKDLFSIDDIDYVGTLDSIKADISFKGFNIWILICSIFICSIGLNLNSTAVVIGAMLISPLMGPINGLGFAIGTYDRDLLIKSTKNILVAVSIAVFVSFLFFSIAPVGENLSELKARTSPTILDLFIAIFGGISGFLGNSRQVKTNVIPGVAIATALMPPLCTAGYGLATGQMNYFYGAFYLFFINTVFIGLSAILIVRYLKFPFRIYPDDTVKRKAKIYITLFVIIISVPSIYIYSNVLKRSILKTRVNSFISTHIESESNHVFEKKFTFKDSVTLVELAVLGDHIGQQKKDSLNDLLAINGITNCRFVFYQGDDEGSARTELLGKINESRSQIIEEVFKKNAENLEDKNVLIAQLEERIKLISGNELEIKQLYNELEALDFGIDNLGYGRNFEANKRGIDTMNLFIVGWNKNKTKQQIKKDEPRLYNWLTSRAQMDTLVIISK